MQLGGRDPDLFSDLVDKSLLCSICTCVLADPRDTPCYHVFCNLCITTHLSTGKNNCPNDRLPLTLADLRPSNIVVRDLLGKLKAKCDHVKLGCTWEGVWSLLPAHLEKECPHAIIKCPAILCNSRVTRKDLTHHKEICLFQMHKCEYCEMDVFRMELPRHLTVCPEYPEKCSCGLQVPRKKLEDHKATCPDLLIPCERFAAHGCKEMVLRKDLAQHDDIFMVNHLTLVLKVVEALKHQVTEKEKEKDEAMAKRDRLQAERERERDRIQAERERERERAQASREMERDRIFREEMLAMKKEVEALKAELIMQKKQTAASRGYATTTSGYTVAYPATTAKQAPQVYYATFQPQPEPPSRIVKKGTLTKEELAKLCEEFNDKLDPVVLKNTTVSELEARLSARHKVQILS